MFNVSALFENWSIDEVKAYGQNP